MQGCEAITLRHVHTRERLVDLAAFFLHRRVTRLPEAQHRLLEDMHQSDAVLTGRKVLVVDDDIRNIFALTSVLEEHGMTVVSAGNGRDALRIMATQIAIDMVLMDIMMPEMDGMATMREARKIPACRDLPIIAVTAKAMKGDREQCIEAGAWDYLSKPVDPASHAGGHAFLALPSSEATDLSRKLHGQCRARRHPDCRRLAGEACSPIG